MTNEVIKKYIWETESGACDQCQALNSTEYEDANDVPDRPHPNCKCNVREVFVAGCDCWEQIDDMGEALEDARFVKNDAENALDELKGFLSEKYIEPVRETIEELISDLSQVIGTFSDFVDNWEKMKEINKETYHVGTPEYYHAKANCEAAQRGEIGEQTAIILGEIREFTDYYKDIYIKGQTAEQASYNNDYDLSQNKAGRVLGKENSDKSCDEVLKDKKPKNLPEKSW